MSRHECSSSRGYGCSGQPGEIFKKKTFSFRENTSFWFKLKHLRIGFMGSGMGVCLDWGPRVSSFGFQRKQDFLFSVKTPCMGFVCSLSVMPPSSLEWPKVFPPGLYLRYLSCLTALGMCCHNCDPILKACFWFECYDFHHQKHATSPVCCHVDIIGRQASSL